jgi:hypothetical protein
MDQEPIGRRIGYEMKGKPEKNWYTYLKNKTTTSKPGIQMSITFNKYTNQPNFVGYPLYYILDSAAYYQTTTLCADCCREEYNEDDGDRVEKHVNYENHSMYCEGCSEHIEAAYEEDDSEDEDDYV